MLPRSLQCRGPLSLLNLETNKSYLTLLLSVIDINSNELEVSIRKEVVSLLGWNKKLTFED